MGSLFPKSTPSCHNTSIVVTGSEVSAGKTFVSVNLALLWAASTADRVLLVDGDLRRPQFHTLFQIPRRPGLADVLSRRCRLEESTAFISEVGLHVMSAGRAGSPRHLVNPDRVRQAIESMQAAFDIVIFDSPPLSGIVDSRSFAAAADGVLMVVRARETRLPSLQKAMECLFDAPLRNLEAEKDRKGLPAPVPYRAPTAEFDGAGFLRRAGFLRPGA